MKRNLILCLAVAVLAMVATACAGLRAKLSDPQKPNAVRDALYTPTSTVTPAATNWVTQTNWINQTNVVIETRTVTTTNAENKPVVQFIPFTNYIPVQVPQLVQTPIVTPPSTNTTWSESNVASTVTAGLGFIPGWGSVAGMAATLLLTLGKLYLNKDNKTMLLATVQGIEQIRVQLRQSGPQGVALDNQIKQTLAKAHLDAGVGDAIARVVAENTDYTTKGAEIAAILTQPASK